MSWDQRSGEYRKIQRKIQGITGYLRYITRLCQSDHKLRQSFEWKDRRLQFGNKRTGSSVYRYIPDAGSHRIYHNRRSALWQWDFKEDIQGHTYGAWRRGSFCPYGWSVLKAWQFFTCKEKEHTERYTRREQTDPFSACGWRSAECIIRRRDSTCPDR